MVRRRRAWLGPPIMGFALLAGITAGPDATGAADPRWEPPPCSGAPVPDPGDPEPAGRTWFRLEPVLGTDGELVSRDLELGVTGAAAHRLTLAPESFASAPVDGRVVVGSDDGRRSLLRVIDPAARCFVDAGERRDVVRSALLTTGGDALIEHRVARRTREDLGIWRRSLDGAGESRILDPIAPDARYGPTFVTLLLQGPSGALAVASCAELECRTRVLDPDGTVRTIEPTGEPIGLTAAALVAYQACPGLPCAVERIDRVSLERTVLAEAAGLATLAGEGGEVLVHEVVDRHGPQLVAVSIPDGRARPLGPMPEQLRLVAGAHRAEAALETGRDDVVLAADGRVGRGAPATRLLDLRTGATAPLDEVP